MTKNRRTSKIIVLCKSKKKIKNDNMNQMNLVLLSPIDNDSSIEIDNNTVLITSNKLTLPK